MRVDFYKSDLDRNSILVRKDSLSGNIFPGLRKSSTVMSSPKLPRPSLEKKPTEGKTAWEDLDNKFNKRK